LFVSFAPPTLAATCLPLQSRRARARHGMEEAMDNVWLASALWIGLALIASVLSVWVTISVALTEIVVGAVAGNIVGLPLAPWVNFLAGFGPFCSPSWPAQRSTRRWCESIFGRASASG
jgi:hypothetical protein